MGIARAKALKLVTQTGQVMQESQAAMRCLDFILSAPEVSSILELRTSYKIVSSKDQGQRRGVELPNCR
jgi:hypothetical protein